VSAKTRTIASVRAQKPPICGVCTRTVEVVRRLPYRGAWLWVCVDCLAQAQPFVDDYQPPKKQTKP
jgi:hypothetical protein